MRLAVWLVACVMFLWTYALVWRVHDAMLRHMREWTVLTRDVLELVPDDDARAAQYRRAGEMMGRQVAELRAIRAWPFPIRLGKPDA